MAKRQTSSQRDSLIISRHESANRDIIIDRSVPKVVQTLPGIGINIMKSNPPGLNAQTVYQSLNQGKSTIVNDGPCQLQYKNYGLCVRRNPHLNDCQHFSETLRTCRQLNLLN